MDKSHVPVTCLLDWSEEKIKTRSTQALLAFIYHLLISKQLPSHIPHDILFVTFFVISVHNYKVWFNCLILQTRDSVLYCTTTELRVQYSSK